MKTTIDKAGRIIVPKSVRDRHNMYPGAVIEIEEGSEGVLLRVAEKGPSLVRKQGILVHHGGETVDVNLADYINRERERRNSDIVAEKPYP